MGGKADLPPLHFQSGAVGRGLGLPPHTATATASAAGHTVCPAPTVQGVEVFENAVWDTVQFRDIQQMLLSNSSNMTLKQMSRPMNPESWSKHELKCCTTLKRAIPRKIKTIQKYTITITEKTVPSIFQLTHRMSDVLGTQ